MKPIGFGGVIAPQLPQSHADRQWVITCWQMTWKGRFKAFWTGKVWLSQWTFNQALQPQRVSIEAPFEVDKDLLKKHERATA